MNAEDAPIMHISHIQKQAPGPPRQIAVDTHMMFPVPTREAVETSIACKEDTEFLSSECSKKEYYRFKKQPDLHASCP